MLNKIAAIENSAVIGTVLCMYYEQLKANDFHYQFILAPNDSSIYEELNELMHESDAYQEVGKEAVEIESSNDSEAPLISIGSVALNSCIHWVEEKDIPIKDIIYLKEFRETAIIKNIY